MGCYSIKESDNIAEAKWFIENKKWLSAFFRKVNKNGDYWDIRRLFERKAHYSMVFSERSTGKTTNVGALCIEQYLQTGMQSVYVKRYSKDITRSAMMDTYGNIIPLLSKLTNEWNNVVYDSKRFYLSLMDDSGKEVKRDTKPFMYVLPLSTQDAVKSVFNNNNVGIVWFEEFITRDRYLPDEFIRFQNLLSTCVRMDDKAIVVMTANTVNLYCPYFSEMGLYKVKEQRIGTIDVYTYGDSELRVAVEYGGAAKIDKKSNVYFGFNNPKLDMIKKGSWEFASYPHPDWRVRDDDIVMDDIWFCMGDSMVRGWLNIQCGTGQMYMLITPTDVSRETLKLKPSTMVFSDEQSIKAHYTLFFNSSFGKLVLSMLQQGYVYYSDNSVGEVMNNFLIKYREYGIIKR